MKKLNEKGFAISAVLYTMLILMILLMFLVLAILGNGRTTANKFSSKIKDELDGKTYDSISEETPKLLYDAVKENTNYKGKDENVEFFPLDVEGDKTKYPEYSLKHNGVFLKTSTAGAVAPNYPVYYYRGNVEDNYVVFAGYCWRIVRTTSSGGIKMIYSGKPSASSCDAKHWDLVYGGKDGKSAYSDNGSRRYANSIIATAAKNLLTDIDKNIGSKNLNDYLEQMNLCNDWDLNYTNPAWEKLKVGNLTFPCSFTVTSQIGLLDVDELVRAGGFITSEKVKINYYLRIDQPDPNYKNEEETYGNTYNINYAIMTGAPYISNGTTQNGIIYVGGEGQIDSYSLTNKYGVRPVISLKAGTTYIIGDGTQNNPYVVD